MSFELEVAKAVTERLSAAHSEGRGREYLTTLSDAESNTLWKFLRRLGWWLPDDQRSTQERLVWWLFRDDLTCPDLSDGTVRYRPETPEDRLRIAKQGIESIAKSVVIEATSCLSVGAYVRSVLGKTEHNSPPLCDRWRVDWPDEFRPANPAESIRDDTDDPLYKQLAFDEYCHRFDGELLDVALNEAATRLGLPSHRLKFQEPTGHPVSSEMRAHRDLVKWLENWRDAMVRAAFVRQEVPLGWTLSDTTWPNCPIKTVGHLREWLSWWLTRIHESRSYYLSSPENYLGDIQRELANTQLAMWKWKQPLPKDFNAKPANIRDAEVQLMKLIDELVPDSSNATPEVTSESPKPVNGVISTGDFESRQHLPDLGARVTTFITSTVGKGPQAIAWIPNNHSELSFLRAECGHLLKLIECNPPDDVFRGAAGATLGVAKLKAGALQLPVAIDIRTTKDRDGFEIELCEVVFPAVERMSIQFDMEKRTYRGERHFKSEFPARLSHFRKDSVTCLEQWILTLDRWLAELSVKPTKTAPSAKTLAVGNEARNTATDATSELPKSVEDQSKSDLAGNQFPSEFRLAWPEFPYRAEPFSVMSRAGRQPTQWDSNSWSGLFRDTGAMSSIRLSGTPDPGSVVSTESSPKRQAFYVFSDEEVSVLRQSFPHCSYLDELRLSEVDAYLLSHDCEPNGRSAKALVGMLAGILNNQKSPPPPNSLQENLLLLLSDFRESGVPLIEVPSELQNPDLLNVLYRDAKFVEFVRRCRCRVGRDSLLVLEGGLEVTGSDSMASDVLKSALADDVETPELRVRIRLTKTGQLEVSRIRLKCQTAEPSKSGHADQRVDLADGQNANPQQASITNGTSQDTGAKQEVNAPQVTADEVAEWLEAMDNSTMKSRDGTEWSEVSRRKLLTEVREHFKRPVTEHAVRTAMENLGWAGKRKQGRKSRPKHVQSSVAGGLAEARLGFIRLMRAESCVGRGV